jgi:hypothetical protein
MMFFSVFSPIGFHNLLEVRNITRILRTSSFPVKLACQVTNYSGDVANLGSQSIKPAALAYRCCTGMAKAFRNEPGASGKRGLNQRHLSPFPEPVSQA